jgi:hypothetical protein
MSDIARIDTPEQLQELAEKLGVRPDWHEPDEQEVTAHVDGDCFDNAGFWPRDKYTGQGMEMHVTLRQHGEVVAQVNLATLFAMAARKI